MKDEATFTTSEVLTVTVPGHRAIRDLKKVSEWNGMWELKDPKGRKMIVMTDQRPFADVFRIATMRNFPSASGAAQMNMDLLEPLEPAPAANPHWIGGSSMKGITTIAALPSGAGQASHLPAEVGVAKPAFRGDGWMTIRQRELAEEYAFTPFSTVTAIDQSPESIARLIHVTSPARYEVRECVLSDDPMTLLLTRGLAMPAGAPTIYLSDECFATFHRIVTLDERLAQQLNDAGYLLSLWIDVSLGFGWEVQRVPA